MNILFTLGLNLSNFIQKMTRGAEKIAPNNEPQNMRRGKRIESELSYLEGAIDALAQLQQFLTDACVHITNSYILVDENEDEFDDVEDAEDVNNSASKQISEQYSEGFAVHIESGDPEEMLQDLTSKFPALGNLLEVNSVLYDENVDKNASEDMLQLSRDATIQLQQLQQLQQE